MGEYSSPLDNICKLAADLRYLLETRNNYLNFAKWVSQLKPQDLNSADGRQLAILINTASAFMGDQ